MSGYTNWLPIGYGENYYFDENGLGHPFRGTFDGNNHTISGLTIDDEDGCKGLFGSVELGKIKNIKLVNVNVKGRSLVGGLCGRVRYATIDNCSVHGYVEGYKNNVGGICGSISHTLLTNCSNYAEVVGGSGICSQSDSAGVLQTA